MSLPVLHALHITYIKLKSEHSLGKRPIQNGRHHYKMKKFLVRVLTIGIILCLEKSRLFSAILDLGQPSLAMECWIQRVWVRMTSQKSSQSFPVTQKQNKAKLRFTNPKRVIKDTKLFISRNFLNWKYRKMLKFSKRKKFIVRHRQRQALWGLGMMLRTKPRLDSQRWRQLRREMWVLPSNFLLISTTKRSCVLIKNGNNIRLRIALNFGVKIIPSHRCLLPNSFSRNFCLSEQ